jgi:hypothetical protein
MRLTGAEVEPQTGILPFVFSTLGLGSKSKFDQPADGFRT